MNFQFSNVFLFFFFSETSLMSHMQNCQDILPLEDKVKNSDLVIVGSVLPDMSLEVVKIIKGHSLHRAKLPENGKACFENSATRQIFFLSTERQGRSVAEHEMDQIYVPKYPALRATPKIVDIIEKLALDIGEKQPTVLAEPVLQGSLNVEGKKNRFLICGMGPQKIFYVPTYQTYYSIFKFLNLKMFS